MLSIALAALLQTASAPVQGQVSPDHQPATLDAMLAAKDYRKLGDTIRSVSRQEDLRSDLDWLKDKMMSGESAWISMLYARLLWAASEGLPAGAQSQLRQTAAMATLYAFAAIQIDGTRCGDRTAPANRFQQLMGWNKDVWPFIASLSEPERATMLKLVPLIESRTAAKRDQQGDVEFLCRAGMEETAYNLKNGTAVEAPPVPGQFGRNVVLSGDGKYKPSERAESEWKPDAEKYRAALPQALAKQFATLSALGPSPK